MLKMFAKTAGFLLILSFLSNCGDVQNFNTPKQGETIAINRVLKNWREGYQNEDIEMYMSAFWEEGFLYTSDMGTDNDQTDDLVFDDIRDERDAAIRVFNRFQDIDIELSEPPDVQFLGDRTRAEVRNHYRIEGFVADGESLDGGFTGWFAEGDNVFTLELRTNSKTGKKEWRITEWLDEAFSIEEIEASNNL